ncbi:MAG: hypothetical protein CMJ48_11310 [Planctomycetaceae bacterium]|nr:hypothetical protein [Planctomycetaceae bacterium]
MQSRTLKQALPQRKTAHRRAIWILLFLLPLTCDFVHRRMTSHSDPPGAQVLLEGEAIGFTPKSSVVTCGPHMKNEPPVRSTQDILDRANTLRQGAQLDAE